MLDTSCAALLRLAQAVHQQGYKVALTGEGADEALAGYVWYKAQAIRDAITGTIGPGLPRIFRRLVMGTVAGGRPLLPAERAIRGVRPAQQELFEFIGQARPILYSSSMWDRLGDHDPYADLDITNDRIGRWHPLNQSLYVGYKVMLAGLLMIAKGDRIAMNSSVETRYPFLDDDVIKFCAGSPPNTSCTAGPRSGSSARSPPGSCPRGSPPAQDDVPGQHVGHVPRPRPSAVGRPAPEPRVAQGDRLFRPDHGGAPARLAGADPADHAGAVRLRRGADVRRLDPALAPPLLRRRALRPVRVAARDAPAAARSGLAGIRLTSGGTLKPVRCSRYDDSRSAPPTHTANRENL